MTALIKSILFSAALALLTAGAAQAKDEKAATDKAPAASKPSSSANAPADKADKSKSGELIDINTASEKELATLPKIGDARAKAIVQGRPYKGKDDLVQKKIISQDVYDGIKDRIIAKQKTGSAGKKNDKGDGKTEVKKSDTKADAAKSDDKKTVEKK
jgi:competence protein ComEA